VTLGTGIGSMPGDDFAEAVRIVLGELPDLPYLPELPARGAGATMIGRSLALVELDADLQPAGWRLTGTAGGQGRDQRRAQSLLAQDLDVLEEQAQEYTGAIKVQTAGPWTLAATVERPRGDRLLADHGARRELAEALADGLGTHIRDVRRRVPGISRLVVQVDEPALAGVIAGAIPTASGYGRHRSVDLPEASALLELVSGAIRDAGAEPWVHSCAPRTPWALVRGAGVAGLSVDLALMSPADHDVLATALEAGETAVLGVVPSVDSVTTDKQVVTAVLRWLDMLGLDPAEHGERIVVTPTCGLAGASPAYTRAALALVRTSAAALR
jgi:methionine synthase II (cobalamin-independent)